MATAPSEVIDGEVVKEEGLAVRSPQGLETWTPRLTVSVDDAVAQVDMKRQFMDRVMRRDEHYGVIPGTGTKPTLLKPGAELLLSSMSLHPELTDAAPPVIDITGQDHAGEAYIEYRRACTIWRYDRHTGEKLFVGRAEGVCNSWEKKYRFRQPELRCPNCGKVTIIRGKAEYGGGWLCWKKKGGCGEKFKTADPRIASQPQEPIPNPEIADLMNTILKMADKRALVAATLNATGCSDLFTQDQEDTGPHPSDNEWSPAESEPPAAVERPSERAEGSRGATTSPVPPATTSAAPPRPLAKNPVTLRRKPAEVAEEPPPLAEVPTGEIPPNQASQETRRVLEEIAAHDRDNAPAGPLTWDSLLKWEREELVTLFGILNTRLTPPERWTPRKVTEYLAAGSSVSDLSYELKQKIAALPVARPAK